MKISGLGHTNFISNMASVAGKNPDKKDNNYEKVKEDILEISDKGKNMLGANMSASSGGDLLRISKGVKDSSYVIHFDDSAKVARALERGYITVNGVDIVLSDEDMEKLEKMDKIAQEQREASFLESSLRRNMEVAKQQSASMEYAMREQERLLKLKLKLISGGTLKPEEERELMEKDPEGYQMAIMLRSINKKKKEDDKEVTSKAEEEYMEKLKERASVNVGEMDFPCKGYETTLNISFTDSIPQVGAVSISSFDINN